MSNDEKLLVELLPPTGGGAIQYVVLREVESKVLLYIGEGITAAKARAAARAFAVSSGFKII